MLFAGIGKNNVSRQDRLTNLLSYQGSDVYAMCAVTYTRYVRGDVPYREYPYRRYTPLFTRVESLTPSRVRPSW
jgi:hypothetical protein